ncbi:beta-casp domain protein [Cystoisospora suis]|uniref:Beta-casp domain protein n=1 Tax=Cystoisospora suis TaxID=483139 RepID=A0A2C6KBK6_9APIC|nr:beta-casp domain protein [Cystoisospora suis]
MLSSSCEQRRDDSSSLPVNDRSREGFSGDDSTSRGKTQHSSHSERKGEGDKKKFSFNKENEELLCCCFSKKCFGFSVPAYMTQPAQRLGLVALDGAVRSRGCWGVCTPPNLEGGWINSPEWLVNQSGVQDGNEDEEQERKDEKDRSESKDERILVGKLYSCKSEADALLGSSISVSLADVNDVMQACRTLRYDERVCLRPRRRKQERRREEVERKTRGEDLERDEEKQGSMSPCGLTGGEECESDEDDDDVEVYVHCVRAGHTIGGAVWLFDAGGRKIIFGVDHCLSPLWHVDSSSLLHLLPSLLPTPSNPSPSSAFSSPSRWSFSPPCLFISDVHHSPVGASSWRYVYAISLSFFHFISFCLFLSFLSFLFSGVYSRVMGASYFPYVRRAWFPLYDRTIPGRSVACAGIDKRRAISIIM